MELHQRTILITGGTSGLGLEFARQLLALGNTVLLTGRDPARLAQTQRELPQVHTFQSDVSDPAAIEQLYAQVTTHFPALSVVINNAGEMRKLDLQDPALDLRDVTRELDSNLAGPIRMVQQFLPHLLAQPTAAILNVTSGLALVPYPLAPVYGATKAGLRSYTKALRVQLQNTRVQVVELIAPGAKTPLNDSFAGDVQEKDLMDPRPLIAQTLRAMQQDKSEVYPGIATALRYLSRLAPGLLLKQLSKGVAESLAQLKPTAPAAR
ncbi:short-chain dehydrogenase [Hymenobacter psoromatis]|nr:short-chain dehydrogenase [Hymenobacter psoromatis]